MKVGIAARTARPEVRDRETGSGDWSLRAGYGLGFLTLISAFNYLDRSLLGLALPAIKAEMHLTDTALGLVSGIAFLLFYSLLGVPIAWLSDHGNRRNIIAAGFVFWSLMTMLTGWVANLWQLVLVRFLMGAGEACSLAPSNSVISDLFRKERRPLALSLFGTASSIAFMLFFPALGIVGDAHGWRRMFVIAGLPGILLAPVFVLTVREPARTGVPARAKPGKPKGIFAAVRILLSSRAYLYLLLASTLMGMNVFAASTWTPTFLQRVHHLTMGEVASVVGVIKGGCGLAGVLVGGIAIDRLISRSPRWRWMIPGLSCLALVPVELTFLLANAPPIWLFAFAASSFLTLVHQGPLFALVMEVAASRMRAVAIAVLVLCSGLFGQAIGPLAVGMLDDRLAPTFGGGAIRYSLLILVVTAALAGAAILMAGRQLGGLRQRSSEIAEGSGGAVPRQ